MRVPFTCVYIFLHISQLMEWIAATHILEQQKAQFPEWHPDKRLPFIPIMLEAPSAEMLSQ